jgi:class 3 adenylate cyclase/tetratricopeptide (TPR) repeat protein
MLACPRCGSENPEGFRFCGSCGAALVAETPSERARKTVTVLFADVVGSTALGEQRDPEALRSLMARYFEEARGILERHGGTVEKFIGDAVMAVFGIPVLHEDDALRAVRAASELRRSELRIGVNTGEVVTGEGETLVTGDAVNVAARLEQTAPPGEVLIGRTTFQLVRDAVEVEPLAPLELKGKAAAVEAFRLVSVDPAAEGVTRHFDAPLVGRRRELDLLAHSFERTISEQSCHLFTLLGPAGVGKSRLAAEFFAGLDATVVRGRCLHYGEGITYWPVVEILRQLGERASPTLDAIVHGAGTSSNETFWTVRKLLEEVAHERPLVVVLDDLHWAEPTLLDLVDHIADLSRDAPILLLCLARPELLDGRPGWAGGKLNATTALLEPLGDDEASQLIDELLGGVELDEEARTRIADAAEGNPLFVEEMLALVREDGEVAVPPTIHALLEARLDRLAAEERAVVQRGAVEGKLFHSGAVTELSPEPARAHVPSNLVSLVRKELIRPDQPTFPSDDAFRFRHLLIRDAAYDALAKETRAELHERLAGWLAEHQELVERDELVGYHLEQAYRYRVELAGENGEARPLAERAAERLSAAGHRALLRGDRPAAINLLGRAADLLRACDEHAAELLLHLGQALVEFGELGRAEAVLSEAIEAARISGRRALELRATLEHVQLRIQVDETAVEGFKRAAEEAIPELEQLGDEAALAEGWAKIARVHLIEMKGGAMAGALERSIEHARRAGDRKLEIDSLFWLLRNCWFGPRPVEDGMRLCHEVLEQPGLEPGLESVALQVLGLLHGLRGEFDRGRELLERARTMQLELGMIVAAAAGTAMMEGVVELLAGDAVAAERRLRWGYEILSAAGEKGYNSTQVGLLADALYRQGRYDEAERAALEGKELAAPEDVESQRLWREIQAKILARRGELEEAVRLGREAVELGDRTDSYTRAETRLDLAEVLRLAGRPDEASVLVREAIVVYKQKGMNAGVRLAVATLEAAYP